MKKRCCVFMTIGVCGSWPGAAAAVRGTARRPRHGSIPEPAGEPDLVYAAQALSQVYPRACGGTVEAMTLIDHTQGLSPRLRGNHLVWRLAPFNVRSIPAPAGEPVRFNIVAALGRVYPHACGGTLPAAMETELDWGLSPRLRGNHVRPATVVRVDRSIPAPAGEPPNGVRGRVMARVYPRACGGTWYTPLPWLLYYGLSPRLRGNLGYDPGNIGIMGSIPAPAGEPD